MVSPVNDYYGHRAILNRYAGTSPSAPILGRVQHGWQLYKHDGEPPVARVPDLVWTDADAAVRRWRTRRIGSPFGYLARMEAPGPAVRPGWLLALPYHGHGVDLGGAHRLYADHLLDRAATHDGVTVCLHPIEFGGPIQALYEERGFTVVSNGDRHDPMFLHRMLGHLAHHGTVTSNRMSTGVLYGGLLGRRIDLGGPLAHQVDRATVDIDYEAQLVEHERRFGALRRGLEGAEARALAHRELGTGQLLSPGELRSALGQQRAGALVAHTLRRGNQMRKVLTRRRYGPLPESVGQAGAPITVVTPDRRRNDAGSSSDAIDHEIEGPGSSVAPPVTEV